MILLKNKYFVGLLVLLIFYTIGIIGLNQTQFESLFVSLTPFTLLLTFAMLAWMHGRINKAFILFFVSSFLIGFWVEVAGVHTGALFGIYEYGASLGFKVLEVPLTIGVNWFLLAYASAGIAAYFVKNAWLRGALAAFLMVALDFIIEPVAIELDFWQWEGGTIPVKNYVMWFFTGLIIQFVLRLLRFEPKLKAALIIYLIQMYFFIALNLFL